MRSRMWGRGLIAAALAASVGVAGAAKKDRVVLTGDAGIEQSVRHEIVMYPRYSIWDDSHSCYLKHHRSPTKALRNVPLAICSPCGEVL